MYRGRDQAGLVIVAAVATFLILMDDGSESASGMRGSFKHC